MSSFGSLKRRVLPLLAALGVAALLGGCVAYPADPGYGGYYGYPAYGYGYPAGGYVAFGGGWHDGGWHDGGWHDGGWHR